MFFVDTIRKERRKGIMEQFSFLLRRDEEYLSKKFIFIISILRGSITKNAVIVDLKGSIAGRRTKKPITKDTYTSRMMRPFGIFK